LLYRLAERRSFIVENSDDGLNGGGGTFTSGAARSWVAMKFDRVVCMAAETLLELRDLAKRFGPITAVDGLSFSVGRGEVLGFLGPNGAGKSTTMKMITGFLTPSRGTAVVAGFDVTRDPIEVQRRVGYLPEGAPLYGEMTPKSLLEFVARVRGVAPSQARQLIVAATERLQLESVFHRPIETLSKGFKRRVGLAQAILLDPEVLILDEPTDGLDPNQKHEVRDLLANMAGDKVIVISTHILEEVEAVCSRAIVIGKGRLLADAPPQQLQARSRYHGAVTCVVAAQEAERAIGLIKGLSAVAQVEAENASDARVRLTAFAPEADHGTGDTLGAVRAALEQASLGVDEIFQERGRLDDVFRALTTEPHPGPAAATTAEAPEA
jgi:ABC-2 type transport system ATP-binding protein